MISAQQGHSDAGETVVGRKTVVITITIAKHLVNPNHPGERTRDRHGNNNLFANRNAAIFGGAGIGAGGAQFITPLRTPQTKITEPTTDSRQEKREV